MRPWFVFLLFATVAPAQVVGNEALAAERRVLRPVLPTGTPNSLAVPSDLTSPSNDSTMVLHAYVLVNRSADRYVATFSISESASSVEEATAEVEAKTHAFMQSIEARVRAVSVDPVTQVELFEYEYNAATGATIATEVHAGFEVQRNVIVTYERSDEIGVLAVAAAEIGIHDIARVEYVTDDIASVRAELFETAA
ncbi:MAG: SIMPL domain-containing protein, partial [Bacteroidota bacterium]